MTLGPIIQGLIAQALQTPIDQVEVRFHDVRSFDVNTSPLAIEITAIDSERRRAYLDAGADKVIGAGVKVAFGNDGLPPASVLGDRSFVWIELNYGKFSQI